MNRLKGAGFEAAVEADGDLPAGIAVGARVVAMKKHAGTIRFMGPTRFAAGTWVGVELDSPEGKNDGSVQGERYFTCAPLTGLFTRVSALEPLEDEGLCIDGPSRQLMGDGRQEILEAVGTCAEEVEKLTAVVGRLDAAIDHTLGREASANAGTSTVPAPLAGAAGEEWLGGASEEMASRLEEKLRQSLEEQLRDAASGPLKELLWLASELQQDR